MPRIEINKSVFAEDRRIAELNRRLLVERGWAALNMIGSPGSGKTTLLEACLPRLKRPSVVLAGDVEGSYDAERLWAAGIRAVQINTHGGCHLSAKQVRESLLGLDMPKGALVVIENVGNLVCPAAFDLGESGVLAVLSAAEGHEKPDKYPALFRLADAVAITKADLAAACRFDMDRASQSALAHNPGAQILRLSAVTGEGVQPFIDLLEGWR